MIKFLCFISAYLLLLFQKGDLLLKVNEASLDGLTHSQAVATLKATISLSSVSLVIMEVRERLGQNLLLITRFVRGLRPASEHPILFQVGCFGRNFRDSCSIPKL